jgi:Endomembrane protein 70
MQKSFCSSLPLQIRICKLIGTFFLFLSFGQERDVNEESGWKLVHGDVFRPPRSLVLLSALVGIGTQLATLVLIVVLLAIVGMLYIG